MHQPHFNSSPCTNLNSTHSSKPSSGRPAKPSPPSSSEIHTEIAPQDRTEIAPITLRSHQSHPRIALRRHSLHRSHWDHTPGSHRDRTDLSLSWSGAAVLHWYWSISHSLFLLLSIWSDLMNCFLLGFVSVFIYWEMVLYICLEAEKMWGTSRKCVFYIIFSNTTKH